MRDATDVPRDASVVGCVALVLLAAVGVVVAPAGGAVPGATGAGADAVAGASADGVAQVDCSFPVSVTDATGQEVTVSEEPERVVVLAPSAAQTMWAIGAQDKVVGMPVNRYTDYLEGREGKVNVVDARGNPIRERVVNATPDLVLAPNVISNETVRSLRNSGLTVYRYHQADSLSDVYGKTELTGRLVGAFQSAARVSARMQGQVQAIKDAVADEPRPKVYYDLGFGWTAGPNTFIGDVIRTAGGQNVAADDLSSPYGKMNPERVLVENPEWILNTTGTALSRNVGINQSTALEKGQFVTVNPDFLNQPGPRNVQPLAELARALHPDAMADVNLDDVETPEPAQCDAATATSTDTETGTDADGADGTTSTATSTPTQTQTSVSATVSPTFNQAANATATDAPGVGGSAATPTPTESGGGGPGFTAAAALLAVALAALLVRRRR